MILYFFEYYKYPLDKEAKQVYNLKMNFIFKSVIKMSETREYKTRQRFAVEKILSESSGHMTAEDIVRALEAKGEKVGRTTVYRTLERLTEDGKARKYISSGDSSCYQFVNNGSCSEHFHLKCEKCGKLIHIECSHLDELSSHIAEHHGFTVNILKTVLYGICRECAEK